MISWMIGDWPYLLIVHFNKWVEYLFASSYLHVILVLNEAFILQQSYDIQM